MPYGVTAAQSVLDTGATPAPPRQSDSSKNHFRGDTRATSTSFTGVMHALLKPSRGSGAPVVAKPTSPERPQQTFRPRSALDLSGHSFSKTIKTEINRSKIAKANGAHVGGGGGGSGGMPRNGWWDRSGGLGMDDSLSRPSSGRSVGAASAAYVADPARATNLRGPPRAPVAAASGGSAIQHQQRQRVLLQQQQQQQQQQQSRKMCRPRSHGDAILDELSRAVGLQ
eukprot:g8612.t1